MHLIMPYSPKCLERLSEKVLGQRSEREFGRQADYEIGQKGTSWDPVGLLHGHLRVFSDSLRETVWKFSDTGQTPHHQTDHGRVDERLTGGA